MTKLPVERVVQRSEPQHALPGQEDQHGKPRDSHHDLFHERAARRCSSTWWIRRSSGKRSRHPEKHRDLFVRVSGYSAEFTGLSEIAQDEIISRTEFEMRRMNVQLPVASSRVLPETLL
ncbi:MAG: hypothetical protein MZU91_08640 [Desulfosudis oleivorans]|nr:hypothetical protein [Desulfosudis oleivorans]